MAFSTALTRWTPSTEKAVSTAEAASADDTDFPNGMVAVPFWSLVFWAVSFGIDGFALSRPRNLLKVIASSNNEGGSVGVPDLTRSVVGVASTTTQDFGSNFLSEVQGLSRSLGAVVAAGG